MGKVCMNCFESYSNEITNLTAYHDEDGLFFICPKRGCGGEIIEIDDLLVSTIILLNKKGYYTEESCSGHIEDIFAAPYIIFSPEVEMLPNIPISCSLGVLETPEGDKQLVLTRDIDEENTIYRYQAILNNALQWYNWALTLPDAKNLDEDETVKATPEIIKMDPSKLKKDVKTETISIDDFMNLLKNNQSLSEEKKEEESKPKKKKVTTKKKEKNKDN